MKTLTSRTPGLKRPLHIKRKPPLQLKLRMPHALHKELVAVATARGTSLNNTINALLRHALESSDHGVLDELRSIVAGFYRQNGEPPAPL